MQLNETTSQQVLRGDLRKYFAGIMTEETRESLRNIDKSSEMRKKIFQQLGADGMLGLGWPVEYGGGGRPPSDQFILFDEAQRANCPMPFVTLNTVGPTIIEFGTEEQKQKYLPGILKGEIIFACGYSEPSAGTDLASLRTKAIKDGDEWIINGGKIYTSGANEADYVWIACRTDPAAKKHKGITLLYTIITN